MKTHLWYEPGVPQSHLDATEFAAEAFAGIRNESADIEAKLLGVEIPLLPSGQYDSGWIENVTTSSDCKLVVVTARDLGATSLNFCFGRSNFSGGTVIASSSRIDQDTTFAGLVLHELGHSSGLVEPTEARYDKASQFAGHCVNDCVMQPVGNIQEMNGVVDKIVTSPRTAGFCGGCADHLTTG